MTSKDSRAKMAQLLDQVEAGLTAASQAGATPIQLAMALVLPFARQMLDDTPSDVLDSMVEQFLAGYASLRPDEADPVIILRAIDVPDGASPVRYVRPLWDSDFNLERFLAGDTGQILVELGEPISVTGLTGWA